MRVIIMVMVMRTTLSMFMFFIAMIMIVAMGMVMMTPGAMRVTVGLFFFGSIAHFNHFDVEMENFACERVISIDMDLVPFYRIHRENNISAFTMRLKLHSGFHFHI